MQRRGRHAEKDKEERGCLVSQLVSPFGAWLWPLHAARHTKHSAFLISLILVGNHMRLHILHSRPARGDERLNKAEHNKKQDFEKSKENIGIKIFFVQASLVSSMHSVLVDK